MKVDDEGTQEADGADCKGIDYSAFVRHISFAAGADSDGSNDQDDAEDNVEDEDCIESTFCIEFE